MRQTDRPASGNSDGGDVDRFGRYLPWVTPQKKPKVLFFVFVCFFNLRVGSRLPWFSGSIRKVEGFRIKKSRCPPVDRLKEPVSEVDAPERVQIRTLVRVCLLRYSTSWLGGRLTGWLVGWLLACLLAWLGGWVGGWVVGWSGGWVVGWLGGWVVGWLGAWSGDWFAGCAFVACLVRVCCCVILHIPNVKFWPNLIEFQCLFEWDGLLVFVWQGRVPFRATSPFRPRQPS